MQCPACQRPLRSFQAGPLRLDGCDGGCGGIWFDQRELGKALRPQPDLDAKVADIFHDPDVPVDDYAVRACPRCDAVMLDKKLYSLGSGVILDRCPRCHGVWLDNGELEKIQAARPQRQQARGEGDAAFATNISFDVLRQMQLLHLGRLPETDSSAGPLR